MIKKFNKGNKMALATAKSTINHNYQTMNVLITGSPGVGKSTFASQLGDNVYILDFEYGYKHLSVFKSDITSWNDFENAVTAFHTDKHNFKHVVIDVVDTLHQFAENEICKRNKVEAINLIPFGAGYKATKRLMMDEFRRINNLGIGITFVTHEKTKEHNEGSITYNAKWTSLSDSVEDMIFGMCDIAFYCDIDKDKKRIARTQPNKWIKCAKDRSNKLQ
jgi:AAA domain